MARIEWPQGRAAAGETEAQVFGYDELDRLTGFQQGRWQGASFFNTVRTSAHDWTLDELGNWRQHTDRSRSAAGPTVSLGVDPANAYTQWLSDDNGDGTIQSAESVALAYDEARGFLVRQPTADGKGWKYWHDGFGRLSKVERCSDTACSGAPESTVEYRYTADGRLAWRDRTSDAAAGVWLLYDGGQVIAEQSASERQSWSVWSGGSVVQWRGKLAPNGSVDTLQLHQDRIGSVVSGTRWNGTEQKTEVWMQRQFDPYGRRVVSIGWERNEPEQPYGFAGQRLDAETGLYLMGARWYSAELGRFIEQDPIAEGGGLNLYAYVGSSPTLWVDPSGLKSELLVSGPDGRSLSEKQAARHVEEREARLGAEAAGRFSEEVARQDRHLAQMMQTAAETRENKAIGAIIDALCASSRDGGVAVAEVGQGAVIFVNDPAQGPAAVQLALDRGEDLAVYSPGILNTDMDIARSATRLARDTGRTVIALGNISKGKEFTDLGNFGSRSRETMIAAAIDLLEATASEFGVPSSNSILAESVLTPLNAALEGRNDLSATVIAHSRGAIDVENAAESAGGFPNLGLITVGGAALPSRRSWRWSEEFVGLDPVGNAALARRFILGRGDTLPSPTGALHSFDSYYHCVLGLLLPRVPWTEQPGAENRGVWKR